MSAKPDPQNRKHEHSAFNPKPFELELSSFKKRVEYPAQAIISFIAKVYKSYQNLSEKHQQSFKKVISAKIKDLNLGEHFAKVQNLEKTTLKEFPNFLAAYQALGLKLDSSLVDRTIKLINHPAAKWNPQKLCGVLKTLQQENISYKILGISVAEYIENNAPAIKVATVSELQQFSKCLYNSGHFNLKAYQILAESALQILTNPKGASSLEELAKLHACFAKANFRDQKFSQALVKNLKASVEELSFKTATETLRSLAVLQIIDLAITEKLTTIITQQIAKSPEKNWTQVIANTAWCLTILNEDLAKIFLLRTIPSLQVEGSSVFGNLQLHQTLVALGVRQEKFPIQFSLAEQEQQLTQSNGFEQEVADTLKKVLKNLSIRTQRGNKITLSRHQNIDGIVVDFVVLIKNPDFKFIVECDGVPYHFINRQVSEGHVGNDLVQDKIFAARGFAVVHLNSQEWFAETGGQMKNKENLLRKKIAEVLRTR